MMKKIVAALAALACGTVLAQAVPQGYPGEYAQVIAACQEGRQGRGLQRDSTPSVRAARSSRTSTQLYPDVKVEYNDMNSTELYNRFIAEQASGARAAPT
jgi:iron(III) transport system substrate-binding protein